MGVRVTPGCDPINSFSIATNESLNLDPNVVFGNGNYMVVWSDGRAGHNRIYAARVTPSGTILDPGGIAVGTIDTIPQYSPSIIYTGTQYITAWHNAGRTGISAITGRFLDLNGQPGDTFRIASTSNGVMSTCTAYDGTNFLTVWLEASRPMYLKGQLVSGNGTLIGSPFIITSSIAGKGLFGLCFDGFNYCVTWPDTQIKGQKYNTNGQPVGSAFNVSNSPNTKGSCYVIGGANNRYLNVWVQMATNRFDLYGNLDMPISKVEESTSVLIPNIFLKSNFVQNTIELKGAEKIKATLFDAAGRFVGSIKHGRFDCRHLKCGVYFIQVSNGEIHKVIKIK